MHYNFLERKSKKAIRIRIDKLKLKNKYLDSDKDDFVEACSNMRFTVKKKLHSASR